MSECDRKELFGPCALDKNLEECNECIRNVEKDMANIELSEEDFNKLPSASEITFSCGNTSIQFAVMCRNRLVKIDRICDGDISFTDDMKFAIINGNLYTKQNR